MSISDFLYVSILTVSILTLYLGFIQIERGAMNKLLVVFVCITLFNIVYSYLFREVFVEYRYVDWGSPMGLLYGPLLFYCYRISHKRRISKWDFIIHSCTFVLWIIGYTVFLVSPNFRERYGDMYYSVLDINIVLSWAIYPIVVILKGRKDIAVKYVFYRYMMMILIVLSSFFIPLIILYSGEKVVKEIPMAHLIILIGILLSIITVYFYFLNAIIHSVRSTDSSTLLVATQPKDSAIDVESLEAPREIEPIFYNKINKYLTKEYFLNPAFKLEKMSTDLGIPKPIISQYFQQVYGDSFIRKVNAWRIEHACKLLLNDEVNFNIENIAFACGFSSRASFYRNFSQEKDCTPLAYREKYADLKV